MTFLNVFEKDFVKGIWAGFIFERVWTSECINDFEALVDKEGTELPELFEHAIAVDYYCEIVGWMVGCDAIVVCVCFCCVCHCFVRLVIYFAILR